MFDPIQVIHSETDYKAALEEYESYFDNEPVRGTEEARRFELLGVLLSEYEQREYPIPAASPVQVLQFMMDQSNRKQGDLAQVLGSRSRASEILNGKRDLTIEQIRKLHREWHIPIAALVGDFEHA